MFLQCWSFGGIADPEGKVGDTQLEEYTRSRHEDEMAGTNFIVQSALLLGSAVLLGRRVYCMGHTVLHTLLLLPFLVFSVLLLSFLLYRGPHDSSHSRVRKWHSTTYALQ